MNENPDPAGILTQDARSYDESSKTTYSLIYPVIAEQILTRTGIYEGICLDIGSGPAPLAIAMTRQSHLQVIALDRSLQMQQLIRHNVRSEDLVHRIFPILGDVTAIPLRGCTCHLVISRGSYHYWENLSDAFLEIFRVLKPGGMAYVGGGYGSQKIRDDVNTKREHRKKCGGEGLFPRERFKRYHLSDIETSIITARIREYQIINDESGLWVIIRKSCL